MHGTALGTTRSLYGSLVPCSTVAVADGALVEVLEGLPSGAGVTVVGAAVPDGLAGGVLAARLVAVAVGVALTVGLDSGVGVNVGTAVGSSSTVP